MLSARNRVIREQAAWRGYNQLQSMFGSKSQKYVSDVDEPAQVRNTEEPTGRRGNFAVENK